jgi:predicted phage terminase large subunit-like protein
MTMTFSRIDKKEIAYREFIDTYAARISLGKWKRYRWVVYMLRVIQTELEKGNARVIINASPRHGKSEGSSHWLPTWYLDSYPDKREVLASHGDDFAGKWGLKVRDHFIDKYGPTWTRVKADKRRADDWETTDGGGMRSVGVGGSVTGRGADLLIIEDPHKDLAEAMSPTIRKKTIDWFNGTLYPRLEPSGSIVVVMTRWHESDLSGYLIGEHSDKWVHINLPAFAEDNDPLGRKRGEALCPERFDIEALQKIKEAMGSQLFIGLYQQRPAPLEGALVKRDWFKYYTERPARFDKVIQSWDMSFKETKAGSFVVGQVWGRVGASFYLLEQVRGRWSFTETQRQMILLSQRWPEAKEKLVEDAANGPAIISSLGGTLPGIIPIAAQGSKSARLAAVSGMLEAGNVYLPQKSDWVGDFVEEVCTFPYGAHDDQCDTMSQALSRLYKGTVKLNLIIPEGGVRSAPWRE